MGEGSVSGVDSSGTEITTVNENGYIITGTTTKYTVTVNSGTHNVTLQNANIDVSGTEKKCAFGIASGASVVLELVGENVLKSGDYCASLQVVDGAKVTIDGAGKLDAMATNGDNIPGIGGSSVGTIIINGGVINAEGAHGGAGIGGGIGGSGGSITITGGTVTATGGTWAAGIGGGQSGSGGSITITGGTVTAKGGDDEDDGAGGAGIGGGGKSKSSSGGSITITGGIIETTGGYNGAGIGGGDGGSGGNITITGGTITATGGFDGAGIGGGSSGSGGNITIMGGTITTTGGCGYKGIGDGYYGSGATIALGGGTFPKGLSSSIALQDTLEENYYFRNTSTNQIVTLDESATSISYSFSVTKKDLAYDDATLTLTMPEEGYTYNGKQHIPEVTVQIGGTTLIKDTDYVVSYYNTDGGEADFVNAGTVTVKVTGMDKYQGELTKDYTINKATINSEGITITPYTGIYQDKDTNYAYTLTGKPAGTEEYFSICQDGEWTDWQSAYTEGETETITNIPQMNDAGTLQFRVMLKGNNYKEWTSEELTAEVTQLKMEEEGNTYNFNLTNPVGTDEETGLPFYYYTGSNIKPCSSLEILQGETVIWQDASFQTSDSENENFDFTYSDNVNVGKVTLTADTKEDYANIKGSFSTEFLIKQYKTEKTAELSTDQWTNKAVISAPEGFKICKDPKEEGAASLEIKEESTTVDGTEITYYLRTEEGYLSEAKTITVKVDNTAPTFEGGQGILMDESQWNHLLEGISFDTCFNKTKDVTIKGTDTLSGIEKYYYYLDNSKTEEVLTAEQLEALREANYFTEAADGSFSITEDNNYVIYAYAVDKAGNRSSYICSNGMVIDCTAPDIIYSDLSTEQNQAAFLLGSSEPGISYYMVKDSSAVAPAGIQDFAAETDGVWTANAGVFSVATDTDKTEVSVTGLNVNTEYSIYIITMDKAGNVSASVEKITFTTAKGEYPEERPVAKGLVGNTIKTVSQVTLLDNWNWDETSKAKTIPAGGSVEGTAVYTGSDAENYINTTVKVTISRAACEEDATVLYTKEGEKAPTCTEDGIGHTECKLCNDVIKTGVVVKAAGHGETELKNAKSATCKEAGYTGDTYCKDCGEKISSGEEIAKLDHTWDEGVETKAPTAAEKGVKTYTCSICGETKTEEIPALEVTETPSHTPTPSVTEAPSHTPTPSVTETPKDTTPEVPDETPSQTPTPSASAAPSHTPTPSASVAPSHTPTPSASAAPSKTPTPTTKPTVTKKAPKKGTVLTDKKSKAKYKVVVSNTKNGTVEYVKATNQNAKTITIPAKVTINGIAYKVVSVGKNAFKNNKKITKVTIGSNVKTIGANAFYGCKKLKTVTMGKNITTIGSKAFYKCTALTKITIPSKVKKIGKQAFYGCKKLKTITIKTTKLTTKNVGSKAFKGIHSKATIKVPKSKVKAYKKMLKTKGIGKQVKVKK